MASTNIYPETSFYTIDYGTHWEQLNQQEESRISMYCRLERIDGQEKTFNQIGETSMTEITSRNGETIGTPGDYRKRWARQRAYQNVRWFGEYDQTFLGEVQEPYSETVVSQSAAYGRQCDQVAVDTWLGTNYEGTDGTTTIAFDPGQQIAAGGTDLTVDKLKTARRMLKAAEAFRPGDELICLVTAKQEEALLNDTEYTSADYNRNMPLASGEMNPFLGFRFVQLELLPATASVRSVLCYVKRAAVLVMGDRNVKVSIRDDRSETKQIRTKGLIGATRRQEDSFVEILCDES